MSYLDNIIENKVRDFTLTERHITDILKPVNAAQLVNTIRNPFTGGKDNPYASFDEDAAVIHKLWQGGVFILDPTRTVSLIPSLLAA